MRDRITATAETRRNRSLVAARSERWGYPRYPFFAGCFAVGVALGLLASCASAPQVVASITSPEPLTLSIAAHNFITVAEWDSPNAQSMFLFASTDGRSDNTPDPAPVRLGVAIPWGDDVQPIDSTNAAGWLDFRDLPLAIDCSHFTGTARWLSQDRSAWRFAVDATCDAEPSVRVVADCSGNF